MLNEVQKRIKSGVSYNELYEQGARFLWHSNYYDGPLSGFILFNNEKCWFNMEEIDKNDHYHYRIYRLPDNIKKALECNQRYFEYFVGTHCTYDYNGKRNAYDIKPKHHWPVYYHLLHKDVKLELEKYEVLCEFFI